MFSNRLSYPRLVVVLLGRSQLAVAQQPGGDAKMRWVLHRDYGGGAGPEQVWIDRVSECFLGAHDNLLMGGAITHRRAVLGNPKPIADRFCPATLAASEDGSVFADISLDPATTANRCRSFVRD